MIMAMARSDDFKSPLCRLAFSQGLFKPRAATEGAAKKYGATLIFENRYRPTLEKVIAEVIVEEWGEKGLVRAKAGRMLLEFPELFGTQNAIDHSFLVLDQGIERAKQLQSGQPQWNQGRKQIHAYYSEIDGSVQPYGITLPADYDPAKPACLFVDQDGVQFNTPAVFDHIAALRPGAGGGGSQKGRTLPRHPPARQKHAHPQISKVRDPSEKLTWLG
jgi:hypothetical protein